jgi:catechol 2,3-dioxygenase-like lactoylglutathione lyase family enzyme
MTKAITGIDHLGVVGQDMPANQAAYERLGFLVTEPRPLISKDAAGNDIELGQHSQHFVFGSTYVELTGIVDPSKGSHVEAFLKRYEGLHILCLAAADAEAAATALRAEGIAAPEVMESARFVYYGDTGTARFRWFPIPNDATPEGLICVVQHVNPELVFQDVVRNHPNGAQALTEVTLCSETPDQTVATYRKILQVPPTDGSFGQVLDCGEARLTIVDPDGLAAMYPGTKPPALPCLPAFTVGVADIAHTAMYLRGAGIPFHEETNRLWVEPAFAGGTVVAFDALS